MYSKRKCVINHVYVRKKIYVAHQNSNFSVKFFHRCVFKKYKLRSRKSVSILENNIYHYYYIEQAELQIMKLSEFINNCFLMITILSDTNLYIS